VEGATYTPTQQKLVTVALLGPGVATEHPKGVAVVKVGGELLDVDRIGQLWPPRSGGSRESPDASGFRR